MNVSLTPELEKMIQEKVASGAYQTASEVVREALRLVQERDAAREGERAWVKYANEKVKRGVEQAARGEFVEGVDVVRRLKAAAKRKKVGAA